MDSLLSIVVISVIGPILGSFIGVIRKPSRRFMYNMLSFAAGVMLGLSFISMIPHAVKLSSPETCAAGILLGAIVMYFLDKLIPHVHPEMFKEEPGSEFKKTALYLIVGIFLHNFPEGMAIGAGSVADSKVSIMIALAIAIHNIPEGICTSAPYFHATGKRWKAFLLSSTTSIPILVGYFVAHALYKSIPGEVIGLMIAATAGIMIYISADELIPTSSFKLTNHSTIFSLILGVIFVVLLGLA
ncbi:MAG: hypothetical protein C0609_01590 [Deltaproteobacteria bacterium]|nr:MAG: hypothetical protein C0609_01590 [Deltaproteobacteria bacterium]